MGPLPVPPRHHRGCRGHRPRGRRRIPPATPPPSRRRAQSVPAGGCLWRDCRDRGSGHQRRDRSSTGADGRCTAIYQVFSVAVKGGTANWIGTADPPHEFVFTPDVGPVVADLLAREDSFGEAWNFGGPGPITGREFLTAAYRLRGDSAALPDHRPHAAAHGRVGQPAAPGTRGDALPADDARDPGRRETASVLGGGSPEDSVPRRNPEDDGMIRVATVSCRVTGLAKPGTARSRRRAA